MSEEKRAKTKGSHIDRELVFKLAQMQCTIQEIADAVDVDTKTVQRWCGDLIEKGRSQGRKALRRAQFERAMTGDPRMLVFLGKQYLGQRDQPENSESTQPLPWKEDE